LSGLAAAKEKVAALVKDQHQLLESVRSDDRFLVQLKEVREKLQSLETAHGVYGKIADVACGDNQLARPLGRPVVERRSAGTLRAHRRTAFAVLTAEPRSAVILANPSKSVEWRCTVCCWCAARLSRSCLYGANGRSDRWTGSALRIYLMRVYNGRLEQAISSGLRDIQPHISKMFGGRGRSRNRTPRPTRL
jgi:hypothetical protein